MKNTSSPCSHCLQVRPAHPISEAASSLSHDFHRYRTRMVAASNSTFPLPRPLLIFASHAFPSPSLMPLLMLCYRIVMLTRYVNSYTMISPFCQISSC